MKEVKRVQRAKKRKGNIFLRVALAAFSVYVVAMLVQLHLDIRAKEEQIDALDAAIAEQAAINDILQKQSEDADAYKEQAAREQGFARPGELIIIEVPGN